MQVASETIVVASVVRWGQLMTAGQLYEAKLLIEFTYESTNLAYLDGTIIGHLIRCSFMSALLFSEVGQAEALVITLIEHISKRERRRMRRQLTTAFERVNELRISNGESPLSSHLIDTQLLTCLGVR